MSVRFWTTTEVMPANNARESAALTGAGDIDEFFILENVDQNLVADLHLAVCLRRWILAFRLLLTCFNGPGNRDCLHELHWREIVLCEVTLDGRRDWRAFYDYNRAK